MKPIVLLPLLLLTACQTGMGPPVTAPAGLTVGCLADNRVVAAAARGHETYAATCGHCHGVDGAGHAGRVPSLARNANLVANPQRGIALVRITQSSQAREHGMEVNDLLADLGGLDDNEVADVMTYITNSFGNCLGRAITASEIPSKP